MTSHLTTYSPVQKTVFPGIRPCMVRGLIACTSQRKADFNPRLYHVSSVADEAALRQVWYFLVRIIPPVHCIHSPAIDTVYQQLIHVASSNNTHFRGTRNAHLRKTKPQQSYLILQKTTVFKEQNNWVYKRSFICTEP